MNDYGLAKDDILLENLDQISKNFVIRIKEGKMMA